MNTLIESLRRLYIQKRMNKETIQELYNKEKINKEEFQYIISE